MKRRLLAAGLIAAGLAGGCQKPPVKHYAIKGEIITVDANRQMVTLKHEAIPGLMPAMTMDFLAADVKQIETLKPGDKIKADLVIGENVGHLEKIELVTNLDVKPKAE
jgi:protein SCO1/2